MRGWLESQMFQVQILALDPNNRGMVKQHHGRFMLYSSGCDSRSRYQQLSHGESSITAL